MAKSKHEAFCASALARSFLRSMMLGICAVVLGGRVTPYGSEFIITSNTNPNSVADYYFSMIFETALTSTGYVEIIFPQNQYPTGLTPSTAVIMAPYPTVVPLAFVNGWTVIIPLPYWPAKKPIQVTIKDVQNPSKEGGTGQFQITTRASYDLISSPIEAGAILDDSLHFTVVGLSKPSSNLISASVGFYKTSSHLAGEKSQYLFTMVPGTDLPYNVDFKIAFPSLYDLTSVLSTSCSAVANDSGSTLKGSFYCQVKATAPNVLIIKGNNQAIVKGTQITLSLAKVYNPNYSLITDLFRYQITQASTNTTLEYSYNVIGLTVKPGVMTNVKLSLYYTSYAKYEYFFRRFVLSFKPKNPFVAARIVTDFIAISKCQITSGLLDTSINSNSVCDSFANLMELSNFQTYARSDFSNEYITIQFEAQISPYPLGSTDILATQPVTISTYKDVDMLYLVDQDNTSTSTQISIDPAPQIFPSVSPASVSITTSLNTYVINAATTLTVQIDYLYLPGLPATSYNQIGVLQIEMPEEFTGVPKCTLYTSAILYKDYTCSVNNGMIEVSLSTLAYAFLVNSTPAFPRKLVITNLLNPQYLGSYQIRVNAFFNNALNVEYPYSTPFTAVITAPNLSGATGFGLLSSQPLSKTVLFIQVQYDLGLASGVRTLSDPFTEFSWIEIGLEKGGSNFKTDLGIGAADLSVIDCVAVSGIQDAPNYSTQCSVLSTLDPTYVIIRVQNYDQIQKQVGRVMKIGIPLEFPTNSVAPKYYISIYNSINKIVRLIATFPVTNLIAASGSIPAASGPITCTPATFNLQIQDTEVIPLPVGSISLANYNGIYLPLPVGYSLYQTPVITINSDTYVYGQNYFFFSNLQTLYFLAKSAISGTATITIAQVNTPRNFQSVYQTNAFISQGSSYTSQVAVQFTVPAIYPIASLAVTIDYPDPQIRWAKYTFEFILDKEDITIIEFSFPASYVIAASDPYMEYILGDNIEHYSASNQVTLTTPAANIVRITGFVIPDNTIKSSITLTQITNPSGGSYPVIVYFRKSPGLLDVYAIQKSTVNAVVTGSPFSAQIINFAADSVNSLPNNLNTKAIYLFEFQTTYLIPKGSLIEIEFPAEFSIFYFKSKNYIRCQENSSILRTSYCNYVDSTQFVQMTTYADSDLTKNVILEYYGPVLNQSMTFSSNFKITIYFKGTTAADKIFTTGTGQQPTMSTFFTPLASSSLNYYPINEGERAFYEFTMEFSTVTALLADQSILVQFPLNYDDNLGPYNLTISSSQLQGALKYKLYKRTIVIYGFYAMTVTEAITLKIFGVVNPNRSALTDYLSESFGIGLIDSKLPKTIHGYSLIEASYTIPNISPSLAPGGVNFASIASTNQYARQTSNYTFVIEPLQKVLSTKFGGILYIDFPQDFIVDSYDGTCSINQAFSFFANCYQYNENLRFFFETINQDWDSSTDGYITADISLIRSPDNDGATRNFIAYNYDSMSKLVLGRTYPNLFIASLNFEYEGRLISVNKDVEYDLEVGSYSDLITIDFDVDIVNYAAESTITLTPNVLDASIIISPFPVIISYKSTSATFKIAAPRTILLKTFYITWSKTGDTFPPTYADLRKTKINMVSGSLMRRVRLENIPYIPIDGESYPLYVKVPNPPYSGMTVKICFDNLFTGSDSFNVNQAKVNTTEINFTIDTYQMAYTVFFRSNLVPATVNIYYELSGTDSPSYELYIYDVDELVDDILYVPATGQSILKFPSNYLEPVFSSVGIKQQTVNSVLVDMITRTSVTLSIQADQKGFLFYMVANKRVPIPVFQSLHAPTSNYTLSFSNPIYGVNYIRRTDLTTSFTISNLTPGIDYQIYIYIMNMNLVHQKIYKVISFSSLQPQNIAAFTLKIAQSAIIDDVKTEYMTKIANLVSISTSRIVERVTDCLDSNLDISPDASVLYWNLLLLPDPTNEDYLTTPINLVSLLNDRRADIQDFIPRLDSEQFITMKNLSLNIPSFYAIPSMNTRTISSITIDFSLTQCGTVYVIGVPRAGSANSTIISEALSQANEPTGVIDPTSFQIKQSLNVSNLPVDEYLFSKKYVNTIESTKNITFTLLDDRTVYDFYLGTMNDFQIYNYYLQDSEVVRLTIKTLKDVIPLNIYSILEANYLAYSIMLLMSQLIILL